MNKTIYNFTINLNKEEYIVVDAIECITLADSFLKNKIGTGHGEAKLYVGNESDHLSNFFSNLREDNCFFRKNDFLSFLVDAETEYKEPQQEYLKKDQMPTLYNNLKSELLNFKNELLKFTLYRVNVAPPRLYMNSNSIYYDFMRSIGLPNISYLSVLKIKKINDEKIYFYFKMFIDYKLGITGYQTMEEKQQTETINLSTALSIENKQTLMQARVGQGKYRDKLLKECAFCPFTMINDKRLLIASHIKPWVNSNNNEKIDLKNGFIFTPTFDKLFDKGFITFNEDKTIKISPWISPENQKRLNIYNGKFLPNLPIDRKREEYLKYHRKFIFKE